MTRVLLVTPYYDPNIVGGAEISTQLIAESLVGDVDVLTFGSSDSQRSLNGVNIREMDIPPLEHFWRDGLDRTHTETKAEKAFRMRSMFFCNHRIANHYMSFFKSNAYETVVFNSNEDAFGRPSLWKAAHNAGLHTILTLRDPQLLYRRFPRPVNAFYRFVVRQQLRWIDTFVAPSQYMIDLHARHGMTKHDCHIIPNAVSIEQPNHRGFDEKHGVIFAGSLSARKGVPTLVHASRSFLGDEPLELVGRGELSSWCHEQPGVTVHDWMKRESLYSEMACAKVLVLPSEWPEAFGRVLIEAVLSGTLVVGSNAGGIPEVLNHDERYIFRQGDAGDLAAHVNRILSLDESEYARELRELQSSFRRYSLQNYRNAWGQLLLSPDSAERSCSHE